MRLKVFGGLCSRGSVPQVRTIVAATSQRAACAALKAAGHHVTLHEFRGYWCETGNAVEIEVATKAPMVVFQTSANDFRQDFTPVAALDGGKP